MHFLTENYIKTPQFVQQSNHSQIWRSFSTDAAKKFFSKSHENATLRAFLRTIQDRHAAGV